MGDELRKGCGMGQQNASYMVGGRSLDHFSYLLMNAAKVTMIFLGALCAAVLSIRACRIVIHMRSRAGRTRPGLCLRLYTQEPGD